ncbi:MAG: 2-polyprenylphenol 6-hydroxylase [Deltaproteobacteria bacterium]|nr:2-polyprenylphenol 6-hydroxylase [Deltaproteobacteria bacterium]
MAGRSYSNIRRLKKIVATLVRYGFGELAVELRVLPLPLGLVRLFARRAVSEKPVAERIRLVLEELGPTFVKLGQVASTRADLFPNDWVEEFKKLQDMVWPLPFSEIKAVLEGSLKAPVEDKFISFDETPIASASIAHVHLAVLKDNSLVAVKVKRPHIEKVIEADISVMQSIAGLLERYVPAARRYRPKAMVDEFSRIIRREEDLTVEAANIDRFTLIFKDEPLVKIPRVHWAFTTPEVLTMERISGTPIDEVELIKAKGLDIKKIAVDGIRIFFKQVFEHGIFHADLHPGNIFVDDKGTIIYLDFGIVGRLDRPLRHYLATMLYHLLREDYQGMARLHRQMGLISRDVDMLEFEEALRDITEPIHGKTLEHINISTLLLKLLNTAKHFNMRLQPNLLLLQKSMVIIEGIGRQLYPDVNMWEVARPLIYKWMLKEKLSPRTMFDKGWAGAGDVLEMAKDLPMKTHALLDRTLNDGLKIGFVHERLDTLTVSIDRAGRTVSSGIVAGALILGSALVGVSLEGHDRFLGLPLISWLGIAAALAIVFFQRQEAR